MVDETDLRLRYKQERGDIVVSGLVPVINESLRNILDTQIGTRLFNRGFGSKIRNLLFEPMSSVVAKIILLEVQQALELFEPRVRLLYSESQVFPDYDNNLYKVKLYYEIINSQEVGEFDTFLRRL